MAGKNVCDFLDLVLVLKEDLEALGSFGRVAIAKLCGDMSINDQRGALVAENYGNAFKVAFEFGVDT
jgi:hypothetical protein